jgi:site-specific recombinase XerD
MNALVTLEQPCLPVAFTEALQLARDFTAASKAPATRAAYASDWRIFTSWCSARGLEYLPAIPDTIAAFLADEASKGKRPSTLGRRLAAIKFATESSGILADTDKCPTDDKRVSAVLSGIRRTVGAAPRQKKAAVAEITIAMSATGTSLRALRDRAIILLGFAGAFRRSELVGLNVEDIEFCETGLRVQIAHSKTDQEGIGVKIAIVSGSIACPVEAVRQWLDASGIIAGPLFRRIWNKTNQRLSDQRLKGRVVAAVVKANAERLGLDPKAFGGHSLRSGFLTSAAARGASIFKMMDVSRHKSMETVRGYVRDADLFRDHAGSGLL